MISYHHKLTRLSLLQFAIIQIISQYVGRKVVDKAFLVEMTKMTPALITSAIKELQIEGLISADKLIELTEAGWNELLGVEEAEATGDLHVLTKSCIDYLNEKVGCQVSHETEAVKKLFRALLKRVEPIDKRKMQEKGWTLAQLRELQIKSVIDLKVDEWIGNKEHAKYLRPSTLFGNNFWNYLEQARSKIRQKNKS